MAAATAASPQAMFSVTPVRIYMTAKDRAVAVTISNDAGEPMLLQAELFSWKQKPDGADELALTEDLVLSPPIIKLAPNAKQVVRLARTKPADGSRQLTYRLVMRHVPEAGESKDTVRVPIALALSMPVFITPPNARYRMSCEATRGAAGMLDISCRNTGSAYTQVREIVARQGERTVARFEGGAYILPGAKKTLEVKNDVAAAAGKLQLTVTYDDGHSETFDLTVG